MNTVLSTITKMGIAQILTLRAKQIAKQWLSKKIYIITKDANYWGGRNLDITVTLTGNS